MVIRHSSEMAPGCSISVFVTYPSFLNCALSLELKTGWHIAKMGLSITAAREESSGLPPDLQAGKV